MFALGASAFAVNAITVANASGGPGANLTVGVSSENDVALKTFVVPLVIRSASGGAYPTAITAEYNQNGRLSGVPGTALSEINVLNSYENEDGSCKSNQPGGFGPFAETRDAVAPDYDCAVPNPGDPDAFLIARNKIFGAGLSPGNDGAEPFLLLHFTNGQDLGCYIVDTTCVNPANHILFITEQNVNITPEFNFGEICVVPNQCPTGSYANAAAVVGTQASNSPTGVSDPESDPIEFFLVSGPGSVDQATGEWTYTPTCGDLPSFTVEIEITDKGQGGCGTVTFDVTVEPSPLNISCANVDRLWSGPDAAQTITVTGGCPPYSYAASLGTIDGSGNWSYDQGCADLGTTPVTIDVTDDAGGQISCQFNLNVTNTAPTCSNPVDLTAPTGVPFSVVLGPATDGDGEAITYTLEPGAPAWVSVVGNELQGARPGGDDAPYTVCYSGSDGCESSQICCVNILFESPFVVCFDDGDGLNGVDPYVQTLGGRLAQICVWVDPSTGSSAGVGGFDFLICYDQSGLIFQSAYRGPDLDPTWEYFTWRTGMFGGNCGGACPDGFVRLVGITDMNNGVTPDPSAFSLAGSVACLEFYVTDDQNFVNSCLHVGFCSYDCGDNVISSKDGNKLFLANSGATLGPDYDQELCIDDTKGAEAEPFIDFCQGAICIIPPPDDRGDLNLNGIANEIADAVLYSRFFIYGPSVWDPNPANMEVQVFASDVNNDGIELTVADLIYLIRIITGDAQPFDDENVNPKVAPYANSVNLLTDTKGGKLTVTTDASVELGGAVMVYRYSDLTIGELKTVDGMNVTARAHNGELRVLIAPEITTGGKIPAGTNDLLTIELEGNGSIELVESQVADANGALLEVDAAAKLVPTSYALHQNFPNPFNAGTVIPVTLKDASDYTLTIYNVAGQVVKTFQGEAEAGTLNIRWDGRSNDGTEVASGMYFYRFDTKNFTNTRKMVVLK
ncbi:MAG: hypothetical protein Kow0074_00020 [Candidatus Zixiibacteriota bacterium]